MTARYFRGILLGAMCCIFLSSCATFGWFGGGAQTESDLPSSIEVAQGDDKVAQLESLVKKHVDIVARRRQADAEKLIHRTPYYFKEYSVYTVDWDEVDTDLRETDSRTAPFVANVSLPKQRFSTRLTRDRQAAVSDTRFYRDTGVETLTYELRNGRWVRIGSLFLAEKSEENVNGEWVAVRVIPEEETPLEEERGLFRRVWSGITGN